MFNINFNNSDVTSQYNISNIILQKTQRNTNFVLGIYMSISKRSLVGDTNQLLNDGGCKNYQVWDAKIKESKELNIKVWECLLDIPTEAWYKHAFSFYLRFDILFLFILDVMLL